jgi:hypothetical protein
VYGAHEVSRMFDIDVGQFDAGQSRCLSKSDEIDSELKRNGENSIFLYHCKILQIAIDGGLLCNEKVEIRLVF